MHVKAEKYKIKVNIKLLLWSMKVQPRVNLTVESSVKMGPLIRTMTSASMGLMGVEITEAENIIKGLTVYQRGGGGG